VSPADEKQEQHTVEVASPSDLSLENALKMYDDAKRYTDTGLRTNWDNYFKVYKGKRVIRNYDGISDPVIRESHTIIETLVANIAGGNPKFHFVQTNEEQVADVEILNGMLDYYMICNQMGLKNQEWVREMLLYGTGVLHVAWRDGKPWIENIPLRDFFVDPTSTCMVQGINPARYAGFEYLADKEVLKRQQIYDADKQMMVPKYQHLDDIGYDSTANETSGGASGGNGDHKSMDKAFKDMFNGSTLGDQATSRQIHVILMYDLLSQKLIEVGNRKQFIYYEETHLQREEQTKQVEIEVPDLNDPSGIATKMQKITKKLDAIEPFLPFAVLRDYVDTSQFYGEGEMAVILGDAELLNDYESMDIDNNAYQNTPMYWIDPQFADLAPEIETIPGAVYPIPKGAMGALERPQLSGDLDQKKDRIAARMRAATAADETLQGTTQDKGRITATEVSSSLAQAQNRFGTKISNLENEGYAQLGEIIYKMIQIFVTTQTAVRIVGPMGTEFKDYDPWEFNGEWEAHVELDTTIKQKQLEVGQKNNQIFQQLSDDPHDVFNPVEIKRFIIQHIDPTVTDEKFNKMLAPPANGPTPTEQQDELQRELELHKTEMIAGAQIYDKTTPFIQAQFETSLGFTPDPIHEHQEHTDAMEMGAKQADLLNPMTTADGQADPMMANHGTPGTPAGPAPAGGGPGTPEVPAGPPMPTPALPPPGMPGQPQPA
jgi:hypothetical protein